jgi:uncharacterized protein (TIGR02099 family)
VNSTTKRLLRATEVLAWGIFFAFAALVLALRFWILPDIERYRDDIVEAISRGVGLPVKVSSIEAGWQGLRPQITLTDVRIYDAQAREALVLPLIHNVVAWRSLLAGELRLHRLVLGDGLKLGVRRDPAGELYIAGLKVSPGAARDAGGGFGDWLLAQGEVVVQNAELEWRDEMRGAPPLVLSNLDLKLVSGVARHALGIKARVPAELGGNIELRALVEGSALRPAALDARLFVELGYTDLAAWRAWVDLPITVQSGQGALRVWASIDKGALTEATADVRLADLHARLGDELAPLELASVAGRVQARKLDDGLELSGRGLALVIAHGPAVPQTDFQIVWRPQAGGVVGATLVDLEAVRHLAASLPLPPQLAGALTELAPRGRLADARLEWSGPFDAAQRFAARMRFSDLALQARGALPEFSGLSGTLEATHAKGRLQLASSKSVIALPRVFPEPRIALDTLAGDLQWEHDAASGLAVRISSLNFSNAHASGNIFGSYSRRGEGPGSIDLSALLNRADAAHIDRYLPHGAFMGEPTRQWVANAVRAGEASDVRVRLRGDLRQFPFADPASGEFRVSARFERGVLDYAPGWPRIEDISGDLLFERTRMEIAGRGGAILGARLSDVRVAIPVIARGAHVLVSGQAEGPTAEFLKYVDASPPLKAAAGEFVAGIKAAGRGRLRLKLDIPLSEVPQTRASGDYEFAGNQVSVVPWLPPVEQAGGRFAFSEAGFTLHDLRGRILGGPLTVSGGKRPGRGVEVLARGDAAFDATRAIFDHPLRRHLSGTFPYALTVRAQDGPARLSFESSLRGIESTLPAPLAKSAGDSLLLRVDVVPTPSGERDRISVSLGSLARADLSRRREGGAMQVQRTAVWLSPERDRPIRLPERPGTLVYGSLPELSLDGWLPLFSAGAGGEPQTVALDVKFGAIDAFGRRFSNLQLRASAEPAGWSANVQADELAGDISYRAQEGGRVFARLAHLSIPAETPGAAGAGTRPALRPGELPALDLVADDFIFDGKQLGRVALVGHRDGDDWRIERASMTNADASLTGRGRWRAAPVRTEVEFDIQAADVGRFLARVGFPGLVSRGKAQLHGTLAWHGNPATLDIPTLAGELNLSAQDGQFLEIEPGLGKLIGLMSLQALPKRITLDFRDVFSKGFQFDRISSAARADNGVFKLKEFRMRGSAADVEMSGQADVARETQDLRVRVIPSLGDSAALGITLVNPVAGVAAAIAQRLLKNPLGQIFAYDYSITGSWADPKVVNLMPPPLPPELPNP